MKFRVTVETRSLLGFGTSSTVEVEAENEEEAKENALRVLFLSGPIARTFVTKVMVTRL